MQIKEQVPVLIVGGGISGLTAALFLLKHGIKPVVIEKHASVSVHPRSRGFDVRTMELYRELGLSESIRKAGEVLAPAWGIHSSSSLAAYLKKVKPKKKVKSPIQLKGLESLVKQTPEAGARCTQDIAEPILLAAARERGADILFNTEMLSFTQDMDKVTVAVRDRKTGIESTIEAAYMIAADGSKSSIRDSLEVKTTGKGTLGNLLNIYFEADVSAYIDGKEFSLLLIKEPDMKGLLASINNTDRWVFHLHYDPTQKHLTSLSHDQLILKLQQVIGLPGIKINIITVLPWQPTVKVVTNMQHGRIFLAGDAAHVMTPYGGKGACSGVQDVHNLAWKLAWVLQEKASPALLQTYSKERQPVDLHYAVASGEMADEYGLIKKVILKFYWSFMSVMALHFFHLEKLFPQVPMLMLGQLLGFPEYHYYSKAVIQKQQKEGYVKTGMLKAQPGTRFPHYWLNPEHTTSTLDLLGKDFVLFIANDHAAWKRAASAAGITLHVLHTKGSSAVFKIDEAVLVRPDGFVAWRSNGLPTNPTRTLQGVLKELLSS